MAWTVFTTAFLWTPTMRGFFRPDISTWSVMGIGGTGRSGTFWVFPVLATSALFVFYLHGRNRLRWLLHSLLLAWHGLLTVIVVSGVLQEGRAGYFEGAMWSVRVPLFILVLPFAGFLALAISWVASERRAPRPRDRGSWTAVDRRALVIAILLLPVAIALFQTGQGIDWPTRLATAATIVQWILLCEGLSHPGTSQERATHDAPSSK